ncbi:hypothetical protein WMY93_019052 [Mugilogobius chulae]|uniref:Uncharacterized protein n=1 Tax=Mugilogobius chulae TaxID=88201 RepID=A0AAW0NHC3_9GOBI
MKRSEKKEPACVTTASANHKPPTPFLKAAFKSKAVSDRTSARPTQDAVVVLVSSSGCVPASPGASQASAAALPTEEPPQLGLALLQLRALLDQPPSPELQTDQTRVQTRVQTGTRSRTRVGTRNRNRRRSGETSVEPFGSWDSSDLDSSDLDSSQDSQPDSDSTQDSAEVLDLDRSRS